MGSDRGRRTIFVVEISLFPEFCKKILLLLLFLNLKGLENFFLKRFDRRIGFDRSNRNSTGIVKQETHCTVIASVICKRRNNLTDDSWKVVSISCKFVVSFASNVTHNIFIKMQKRRYIFKKFNFSPAKDILFHRRFPKYRVNKILHEFKLVCLFLESEYSKSISYH